MLVLHLPLTGDIHNQGLLEEETYIAQDLTYSDNGKLGKCLQFNGDPKQILSFVNIPKKKNNFTWACWIKQTNRTSTVYQKTTQYVLSMGRNCGTIGFNIRMINGYLNIHLGSGEDTDTTTSITNKAINIQELQLNIWYHICCIVDNESVNVYINGELVKTFPLIDISYRSNSSGYFTIGKMGFYNNNTSAYFPFNGLIQDVRVYDTVISPRQVKEISKGLVCHYPLGEIDGKIGGRNLLQHSSLVGEQLMCYTIDSMNSVTTKSYEEEGYHIVTPSTGNGNNGVGFKYTDFTSLGIKQGDTITFSCDIKGTSDTHSPFIKIHFSAKAASHIWYGVDSVNSVGVGFIPLKNKWQRISVAFTISDTSEWTGNNMWLAIHGNFESDLYIKNLKLEKSSTATPWTPAPEDDASFYDNVIYDTSGYCNNGSVSGDILWDTNTPRYKGAYDFNGTGYIYNDNLNLTTTAFTISFWIKIPSAITHQHFDFATFNSWTSEGIAIYWDTSGQKSSSGLIFGEDSNGNKIYVAVQCRGKLNEWTHFAITWDGTKVYRYSDGIKFSESDFNVVSVYHPRLWLGNSTFGDRTLENSESCMSDFRFYATALSDSDILELYQSSASVDSNGNLMLAGEVIEE